MTPIDAADVERFRALLGQLLGLASERDTVEPLEVVLRERVAATRAGDVRAYLSGLESGALAGEGRALATRVTIGETYFHRHPTSLRAFVSAVVPDRVAARAGERTLSILSAGCSTGAEPYTLAMLVRELPELAGWDVRIRGVDIDADAIEQARRGRFSTWQLREMAPEAQARWFTPRGPREVELDPAIRGMVDFEVRNLVEPDPAFFRPGAFDVIFCRNVVMYFERATTAALVERFATALAPDGFLFLGHAETLRGLSHDFTLHQAEDAFYYQRRPGLETRAPSLLRATAAPRPGERDASWVDAIGQAAGRLAALVPGGAVAVAGTSAVRASDGASRARRRRALELLQDERFTEALDALGSGAPEADDDGDAELLRAVLLTNLGRVDDAVAVCERLLAADDLDASVHYLMALCREAAGDVADAARHDRAAVYLDPGFAMARLHLGLLAKRAGDLAAAKKELGEALVLLAREDAARIALLGGGFRREALIRLCQSELRAAGGTP